MKCGIEDPVDLLDHDWTANEIAHTLRNFNFARPRGPSGSDARSIHHPEWCAQATRGGSNSRSMAKSGTFIKPTPILFHQFPTLTTTIRATRGPRNGRALSREKTRGQDLRTGPNLFTAAVRTERLAATSSRRLILVCQSRLHLRLDNSDKFSDNAVGPMLSEKKALDIIGGAERDRTLDLLNAIQF
jgi:hypothetical protein